MKILLCGISMKHRAWRQLMLKISFHGKFTLFWLSHLDFLFWLSHLDYGRGVNEARRSEAEVGNLSNQELEKVGSKADGTKLSSSYMSHIWLIYRHQFGFEQRTYLWTTQPEFSRMFGNFDKGPSIFRVKTTLSSAASKPSWSWSNLNLFISCKIL